MEWTLCSGGKLIWYTSFITVVGDCMQIGVGQVYLQSQHVEMECAHFLLRVRVHEAKVSIRECADNNVITCRSNATPDYPVTG